MQFTKSEQQYYDFFAEKDGKRYTIRTHEHRVVNVLVEDIEGVERSLYQRGPEQALYGLTINDKIFEKALLAICQKSLSRWSEVYQELWMDEDYAQPMIQKVFEKNFAL